MQENTDASLNFYQNLTGWRSFDELFHTNVYVALPYDWVVVVADVVGSTAAVEKGLYKSVNAIGVACIVAVVEVTQPVAIPYVFGGDGASFCIPASKLPQVSHALGQVQALAEEQFSLKLRVGGVPVTDIRQQGADVQVAKYAPSEHYEQAMFQGQGLALADGLVKDEKTAARYAFDRPEVNREEVSRLMSGFECRWQEIPAASEQAVSLLVKARRNTTEVYTRVLQVIREIYGCDDVCYPFRKEALELSLDTDDLLVEARIRTAKPSPLRHWLYTFKLKFILTIGRYLMKNAVQTKQTDWGRYQDELIEHTDFQRFDDMLRMTIAGSEQQRLALAAHLEGLHRAGLVYYGMHTSSHCLITCMISDYNHAHVHFLDGKGGGYTLAATQLKQQIKASD